jgi:hypothetical protein
VALQMERLRSERASLRAAHEAQQAKFAELRTAAENDRRTAETRLQSAAAEVRSLREALEEARHRVSAAEGRSRQLQHMYNSAVGRTPAVLGGGGGGSGAHTTGAATPLGGASRPPSPPGGVAGSGQADGTIWLFNDGAFVGSEAHGAALRGAAPGPFAALDAARSGPLRAGLPPASAPVSVPRIASAFAPAVAHVAEAARAFRSPAPAVAAARSVSLTPWGASSGRSSATAIPVGGLRTAGPVALVGRPPYPHARLQAAAAAAAATSAGVARPGSTPDAKRFRGDFF